MVRGQWVYVRGRLGNKPRPQEKMANTAACERLIAAVLLPKYLPQITPTEFNYPVAIYGKCTAISTASYAVPLGSTRLLHP
jgi:hypothetical protein